MNTLWFFFHLVFSKGTKGESYITEGKKGEGNIIAAIADLLHHESVLA